MFKLYVVKSDQPACIVYKLNTGNLTTGQKDYTPEREQEETALACVTNIWIMDPTVALLVTEAHL